MFIYYLKIDFYGWKNIFLICNNVYLDRSELDLSDTTIRIQNFYFCRKLWWKNWWNYYVAEKRIVSKLSKISNPNFNNTDWRLEWKLCQDFTFLYFIVYEKTDIKEREGRTRSGAAGLVHDGNRFYVEKEGKWFIQNWSTTIFKDFSAFM